MQSTTSLLQKLANSYPDFKFASGDCFKWSFNDKVIYYDESEKDLAIYLLHELAHAVLGHSDYKRDVELLRIESDAWDKTISLASEYKIKIDNNLVQENLDSYRDWLHKRSICTNCQAVGIQTNQNTYTCLSCHQSWSVNQAKNCRLVRKSI